MYIAPYPSNHASQTRQQCYHTYMSESDKRQTKQRVYAFIDSQNLNLGVQKFGWKLDWRKFRQLLEEKYGVTKAYLFIGYIPENEALYEQMHELGYSIVLKPTFDLTKPRPELAEGDGSKHAHAEEDKKPVKGNIDAELVLWAMKEMSNYEKAIVVSGDGDFFCLIEYLESKGRLLHLMPPTGHYSNLYNKYADFIVQVDQFKRELAYHDRRKASGRDKPKHR